MARLIDDLFAERHADPLYWIYNVRKPADRPVVRSTPADQEGVTARFAAFRHAAASAPVLVADNVTDLFFQFPATAELGWDLARFPTLWPPHPRFFLETVRPPRGDERQGRVLAHHHLYPEKWGWYGEAPPAGEIAPLVERAAGPGAAAAGLQGGLLLHLAMTYRGAADGQLGILFPLVTVVVQLGGQGEPLGAPALFYPYPHDPSAIADPAYIDALALVLLYPACLALSLLRHPGVTTRPVEHGEKLQKARARRKKPPLFAYRTLQIKPAVEELRFTGNAGLEGLPAALQTCRHQFVPRPSTLYAADGSPLIGSDTIIPGDLLP